MSGVALSKRSNDAENQTLSIEELYDVYFGTLLDHCERILGDRAEAEDAVQETFINAGHSLATFVLKSGYLGWLLRIATNVCLNILRSKRRKGLYLIENPQLTPDKSDDAAHTYALRQTLAQIVTVLSDDEMVFIIDHFITGMDMRQIAENHNISRRAVRKRLRKIRDRIGHLGRGAFEID